MVVESMNRLKDCEAVPFFRQCESSGMAYSSVMRWRSRMREGREPAMAPGPHKVEPLDLPGLELRIEGLKHGKKRTAGTGQLYEEVREQISRRNLQSMVSEARKERNQQKKEELQRIERVMPGLIWGIDDTEYKTDVVRSKAYIHSTRDLGSRYAFNPVVGSRICKGPEIAENLGNLFDKYGAPLFLKRDNAKNLNHDDVDEVLGQYMVLPLNSPPYYPAYNGAVEKGQDEMKKALRRESFGSIRELRLVARVAAHDLDNRHLRSLSGSTPCLSLFGPDNQVRQFTKRRRKEVYEHLTDMAATIMAAAEPVCSVDSSWRLAVEMWLLDNGLIAMSKKRECYPILEKLFVHH